MDSGAVNRATNSCWEVAGVPSSEEGTEVSHGVYTWLVSMT